MTPSAQTTAVILAAGRGHRAGGNVPKQWRDLAGKTVLEHTIARFETHAGIERIVLVVSPEDTERAATLGLDQRATLAIGGSDRAASVRAGLECVNTERVLIHDAARPCVRETVIDAVLGMLNGYQAVAPAIAVTDALWHGAAGEVSGVVSRENLYRAQTPQGFHTDAIRTAHIAHSQTASDDVEVARAAGMPVAIVEGCEDNIKITNPADFARAEMILRAQHGC